MPAPQPSAVLDIDGPAGPPRSNGELVFAEPWEGRAFGLAMSLNATDVFEWEDFRQRLIAAVAEAEREATEEELQLLPVLAGGPGAGAGGRGRGQHRAVAGAGRRARGPSGGPRPHRRPRTRPRPLKGPSFVKVRVEVSSSYPRHELEPLLERASALCYVSNTMRAVDDIEVVLL